MNEFIRICEIVSIKKLNFEGATYREHDLFSLQNLIKDQISLTWPCKYSEKKKK